MPGLFESSCLHAGYTIFHHRLQGEAVAGSFAGVCSYRGPCLKGLACGKATEALSCGLVNWICTLSPKIIVMGGGVMKQSTLFSRVRASVEAMLNGYVPIPETVPPALGDDAGVLGAIALCL